MPGLKNTDERKTEYHALVWEHFNKHLEEFIKKHKDESLHQMRVNIKKIMAICHLIEYCHKDFDKRKMKTLVKIFELSGKVRDLHNGYVFCERFALQKSVFSKVAGKEQSVLRKLKSKHKNRYDTFNALKSEMGVELLTLKTAEIKKYLEVLMKQATKAFNRKMSADELHEIRKKLKDISYLSKMIADNVTGLGSKRRTEVIADLEDLIGEWHDINKFRLHVEGKKQVKKVVLEKIKEKEGLLHAEIMILAAVFKRKKLQKA